MKRLSSICSHLLGVEKLTIAYVLFTLILIVIYGSSLPSVGAMLVLRGAAIGIIIVTHFTHHLLPRRLSLAWRTVPLLALLVWWYPETYDFCSQLPYLDHLFAAADQSLFGCQPSLEFARLLPHTLWSEAFNLGYYAYYYMMAAVIVFFLVCRTDDYNRATTIFLGSFFLFYAIFDLLPVGGPQYYFKALADIYGIDPFALTGNTSDTPAAIAAMKAATGGDTLFPPLGHYLQSHEAAMLPEVRGIFSQLVIGAQEFGEHPTAAFPSSHVGMSTVSMMLAWRSGNRRLFYILLPLYLLLVCATVYIRAHYLIDSICGFIVAVIFYLMFDHISRKD